MSILACLHRCFRLIFVCGFGGLCAAAELRIIDLRLVGTDSTWRLEWNTTSGLDYQVQRSREDRLPEGTNDWVPLTTVRASGEITGANDLVGRTIDQRFY